ncbi:hypothetical protein [Streptomyces sp. NPDC002176]|uniref:hypothetical protein n=1 Tax=Streptomyces sp. NPDC002176 TaxID=3364634 RepID=UPI00384BF976
MEWGTIITVLIGGLIGLSGDTIGRIGAHRQAQRARREGLEDAETARRKAIEDNERKGREDRERLAVENILKAYLGNPIMLLNQPTEEASLSVANICITLGFEQSFLLDRELRHRIAEIGYFLDLAAADGVVEYSLPEVGFLSRSETRMLMGAWSRGEDLPDSIGGWKEIRDSRPQVEARWQEKLRSAGSRVVIPPLSTY